MSINLWRYVKYADDGVSVYQCLKCYEGWSSPHAPGYFYEGAYHTSWSFCPFCGTKWDGMRLTETENKSDCQLGPRRQRIADAIEAEFRKRQDAYWKSENKVGGSPYPYARKEPDWWWVIEKREHPQWTKKGIDDSKPWMPAVIAAGGRVPAARVLEVSRSERERGDEMGTDFDGEVCVRAIIEVRIATVRDSEWNIRYRHAHKPYEIH